MAIPHAFRITCSTLLLSYHEVLNPSIVVLENYGRLETKRESAIRSYKAYVTAISGRLYEDDIKDRCFHIFYNPSKQAAER